MVSLTCDTFTAFVQDYIMSRWGKLDPLWSNVCLLGVSGTILSWNIVASGTLQNYVLFFSEND